MNENDVTNILNQANEKLSGHNEYEEWMTFEGADVTPAGQIIPRFKSTGGNSGMDCPKLPVYQEVWKSLAIELNLK